MAKRNKIQWPKETGQKNKQWSTKQYSENKRPSKRNPTNNRGWTQVLRKGKKVLHSWTLTSSFNTENVYKYLGCWRCHEAAIILLLARSPLTHFNKHSTEALSQQYRGDVRDNIRKTYHFSLILFYCK